MALIINLEELLGAKSVESNRIEFKEGWNKGAIYRSICAFANDFDNSGGGYIVIGAEEENGIAKRPVKGLSTDTIAKIQREMIGLNNLIRPVYHPVLSVEEVDNVQIIVLWIPGSSSRPHEVPEEIEAKQKLYFYYIRKYANSVKAGLEEKQELISLANQTPFDDRANTSATLNDISLLWLREYLRQTNSRLANQIEVINKGVLLDQMELQHGPPEYRFPRNAALMLFCEYPEKFFPYTYIELVHFKKGPADREFSEVTFKGPVQSQIQQLTDYLRSNVLIEKVVKVNYQSEALRIWNYPFEALEEAIANCIFHRDYLAHEPVKVLIHNDKIILRNAGGPDRSIRPEDFQKGQVRPKRYRNRRLGNFLKTLHLTEGHATGIPLILSALQQNGSPDPIFDMDEMRTFFEVEFRMHQSFMVSDSPVPTDSSLLGQLMVSLKFNSLLIVAGMDTQPLRRGEVLALAGLANYSSNATSYLEPLRQLGILNLTIEDRPRSPLQRYVLTDLGIQLKKYLSKGSDFSTTVQPSDIQLAIDFKDNV